MSQPEVYILILNWNNCKDTIKCIESVQQLRYPLFRIILIDNYSTDNSIFKIKSWASAKTIYITEYDHLSEDSRGNEKLESPIWQCHKLVIIQTGANLGYAGGMNVGIRYALKNRADFVWILNNDTIVDKNALTEMINIAILDSQIGIVGCKLLYHDKPINIQSAGGGTFNFWQGLSHQYGWLEEDHGQWDKVFAPYYINGASMLVKCEVVRTVGFMNEAFYLYGEELEWQLRVKQYGWSLIYCPSAKVWHKENSSLGYRAL